MFLPHVSLWRTELHTNHSGSHRGDVMFWCVVETSCGWAEPQAIWMHWIMIQFSRSLFAFYTVDWKMKSNASTDAAGHMKNVPHDNSGRESRTPTFKCPVVAVSCVHPLHVFTVQPHPGIDWNYHFLPCLVHIGYCTGVSFCAVTQCSSLKRK